MRGSSGALPRAARGGLLLNLTGSAPCFSGRTAAMIHDAAVVRPPRGLFAPCSAPGTGSCSHASASVPSACSRSRTFSRTRLAASPRRPGVAVRRAATTRPITSNRWSPRDRVLDRHGLRGRRFLLVVGEREPDQEPGARWSQAFARIAATDLLLVIVGGTNARVFARRGGRRRPAGRRADRPARRRVRSRRSYRHALALVVPSLYEGFGLPRTGGDDPGLRRRWHRMPPRCRRSAAMPRSTSIRALSAAIADALRRIIADDALRVRLQVAGHRQAARFSWAASAERLRVALGGAGRSAMKVLQVSKFYPPVMGGHRSGGLGADRGPASRRHRMPGAVLEPGGRSRCRSALRRATTCCASAPGAGCSRPRWRRPCRCTCGGWPRATTSFTCTCPTRWRRSSLMAAPTSRTRGRALAQRRDPAAAHAQALRAAAELAAAPGRRDRRHQPALRRELGRARPLAEQGQGDPDRHQRQSGSACSRAGGGAAPALRPATDRLRPRSHDVLQGVRRTHRRGGSAARRLRRADRRRRRVAGPLPFDWWPGAVWPTRCICSGHINDHELASHFEACDIFCMSSTVRAEAYGVAMLEAMMMGKPAVASDIAGSGVPWVNRHGETGLNVPPATAALSVPH